MTSAKKCGQELQSVANVAYVAGGTTGNTNFIGWLFRGLKRFEVYS